MGCSSTKVSLPRVAVLFVLLSTVLIFGTWLYARVMYPFDANLGRLRYGMKMEEVRSILGEPSFASAFGHDTQWTYLSTTANGQATMPYFEEGRLVDIDRSGKRFRLASPEGDAK